MADAQTGVVERDENGSTEWIETDPNGQQYLCKRGEKKRRKISPTEAATVLAGGELDDEE